MKPIDSEGAELPDTTMVYIYAPAGEASQVKEPEIWISASEALCNGVEGLGLWSVPLRGVLDEFVREVRGGEMGFDGMAALLREYADKIEAESTKRGA